MKLAYNNQAGSSVLEIIIGLSAFAIMTAAVVSVYHNSMTVLAMSDHQRTAVLVAQEQLERSYAALGHDWSHTGSLTAGDEYHMELVDNQWTFVAGEHTTDTHTYSVHVGEVYRSSNVIAEHGTLDPDTVLITATVAWETKSQPHSIEIATYVSNWK